MDKQKGFLTTPLLYEQILRYLRDLILSGRMEEGKKLNEINLQRLFSTSRAPIREAFRKRLEAEGLVEIKPRRGVCSIDLRAGPLRGRPGKGGARKAGDETGHKEHYFRRLEALSRILAEMNKAVGKKSDIDAYTNARLSLSQIPHR